MARAQGKHREFGINWSVATLQGSQGARPCTPTALMPRAVRAQGLTPNVIMVQGLALMQFEIVFCSPPPLGAKSSKSSVMTCSVEVPPPPANRTTTPCTFTEWQKAFVGPRHQTKILGQKQQINHYGDSNEPPIILQFNMH